MAAKSQRLQIHPSVMVTPSTWVHIPWSSSKSVWGEDELKGKGCLVDHMTEPPLKELSGHLSEFHQDLIEGWGQSEALEVFLNSQCQLHGQQRVPVGQTMPCPP